MHEAPIGFRYKKLCGNKIDKQRQQSSMLGLVPGDHPSRPSRQYSSSQAQWLQFTMYTAMVFIDPNCLELDKHY